MSVRYLLTNIDHIPRLTHVRGTCSPRRAEGRTVEQGYSRTRQDWWLAVLVLIGCVLVTSPCQVAAIDLNTHAQTLTLVDRTVTQNQGAWIVDYRLRNTGKAGVIITPDEITVKVEGWVSNSRVASHAVPRWSSLFIPHGHDLSAVSDVIVAADEAHRCRDRLIVHVWTEDQRPFKSSTFTQPGADTGAGQVLAAAPAEVTNSLPISLGPGANCHVRLCLEHQHILYGDYDPLLSVRAVTLTLGSSSVRDVVPMDREQYLAQPKFVWNEPPEERRDTRHAVTGPDSLHLEAHVPGHQYYRYPERPVRYSTKMRLRFWYLIAAGTEGECRVRVAAVQGYADIMANSQQRWL